MSGHCDRWLGSEENLINRKISLQTSGTLKSQQLGAVVLYIRWYALTHPVCLLQPCVQFVCLRHAFLVAVVTKSPIQYGTPMESSLGKRCDKTTAACLSAHTLPRRNSNFTTPTFLPSTPSSTPLPLRPVAKILCSTYWSDVHLILYVQCSVVLCIRLTDAACVQQIGLLLRLCSYGARTVRAMLPVPPVISRSAGG